MNARTFGEMSLDLDFIFDEGMCESFGSAMVKSRSSDSFTSQLKDFIRPASVNICNCAQVIIRKQTDPDEANNTTSFGYTKNFPTSPASGDTFNLVDDGAQTFTAILGSGYTVNETHCRCGLRLRQRDVRRSTGVTPVSTVRLVTFALDSSTDILDCTYNNQARGTIIVKKITSDGQGAFDFTSSTLPVAVHADDDRCWRGGQGFGHVPDLARAPTTSPRRCLPGGTSLRLRARTAAPRLDQPLRRRDDHVHVHQRARARRDPDHKLRKHAASGSGDQPHPGVTFNVNGVPVVTNGNGDACVEELLFGDHTVTETLPGGYVNVGPLSKDVDVVAEGTCAAGVCRGRVPQHAADERLDQHRLAG